MGTLCSGDALRILDIFTQSSNILISPSNTNPALTDPERFDPPSYYARLIYNDRIQGAVMAAYASSSLLATSAATVDDGGAYGVGLAGAFVESFEGDKVSMSLTDRDLEDIVSELASNPPDVIFFAGNYNSDAIALATLVRSNGVFQNTALAFGDAQAGAGFLEGGDAVEGAYLSTADITAVTDPRFYDDKLIPSYEKKYGEPPPATYPVFGYDIAHVMANAAERAACTTADGRDRIGRAALYRELLATVGFVGLATTYTCDASGDCNPNPAIAILQVQDGAFVKVQ